MQLLIVSSLVPSSVGLDGVQTTTAGRRRWESLSSSATRLAEAVSVDELSPVECLSLHWKSAVTTLDWREFIR